MKPRKPTTSIKYSVTPDSLAGGKKGKSAELDEKSLGAVAGGAVAPKLDKEAGHGRK